MKQWIRLLAVGGLALFLVSTAAAQSEAGGGNDAKKSEKPSLSGAASPHALRLAVLNGVVDFVQNARTATVSLEWDALPLHDELLADVRSMSAESETFSIPNAELSDPAKWSKRLRSERARTWLKDALRVSDLSAYHPQSSDDAFRKYWLLKDGPGYGLLGLTRGLEARRVFGLSRDHNMITTILGSRGISYSLLVDGADVKGQGFQNNLLVSNGSDITWQFQVFRFVVKPDPDPAKVIAYYRMAAKARMAPRTLVFPDTTQTEANLKIDVTLVDSDNTAGLVQTFFHGKDLKLELQEAKRAELENLSDHTTSLDSVLKFVGGGAVGTSDIVTKGFLGGSRKTSIITGGLVGKGTIDQLFGINTEFDPTAKLSPGLLFGLAPDDNKSLFFGPSLRMGIFTLGAGFKSFEQSRTDKRPDGTSVERTSQLIRPAGVISIDLSRASGSKKPAKIELENAAVGGGWGVASDALFADLALVQRELKVSYAGRDAGKYSFTLRQVEDKNGKKIEDDFRQARFLFTLDRPLDQQLLTLPAGRYVYEKIYLPDGYYLYTSLNTKAKEGEGPLLDNGIAQLTWSVRP